MISEPRVRHLQKISNITNEKLMKQMNTLNEYNITFNISNFS